MYQKLYRGGFAVYFILLLIAIVFYKERTIFLDIAYHLFSIIKNNGFAIQAFRYGAVFTQAFPVLGSKLSLSLEAIMLMYSAGFVIYYFICYWVCGSILKQYEMALCLLLFHILFAGKTFYWMQAELPQGCAFMFVMFALLKSTSFKKKDILKLTMILPVIVMAVCFHPIIWIPAVFVAVFFAINNQHLASKPLFFAGTALFFILFYIKTRTFVNPYDTNAMKGSDNMFTLFPNWINLATNRQFLRTCMGDFIWIPISFLLVTITYIIKGKWLQLLLFSGFFVAYLLLVNTTYPHGNTALFYIENLYLPLGIILGLPLIYDVLPILHQRKTAYILMVLIAITGLLRIYNTHYIYTDRINWMREFMAANKNKKLLIAETPALEEKLIMTWGSPFEFWLLSTTENKKTETIFITNRVDNLNTLHWDRKSFITPWEAVPYEVLPSKYFILTDTVSRFEIIK